MKVLMKATNKIVEVKDGYALNFLLPKGLAVLVTNKVQQSLDKIAEKKQADKRAEDQHQQKLAQSLEGKVFTYKTKANQDGELYAGIGEQQIKKVLKIKEKIKVLLDEPIKSIGKQKLLLKIGQHQAHIELIVQAS